MSTVQRNAMMREIRSRANSGSSVGSVTSGTSFSSANSGMSGLSTYSTSSRSTPQQLVVPSPRPSSRYNGNGNSRSVRNRWPMLRPTQTRPRSNAMSGQASVPPKNLNSLKRSINNLRSKMSQNKSSLNQIYRNINSAKKAINNQYKPNINRLTSSISQANSEMKRLQQQGKALTAEANKARKLAKAQEKANRKAGKAMNVNYGFRNKSYMQRAGNFFGGMFRKRT